MEPSAGVLEDTYEEWLQVFKETIGKLKAQGIEPYKIDVDIQELIEFCEEKGLPNNGKARHNLYTPSFISFSVRA
jgi:hypothetical protein